MVKISNLFLISLLFSGCAHQMLRVSDLLPDFEASDLKVLKVEEQPTSFLDSYLVKGSDNKIIYSAEGVLRESGDRLTLKVLENQKDLEIRKLYQGFKYRYEVYEDGKILGIITLNSSPFLRYFYLELENGQNFRVERTVDPNRYFIYIEKRRVAFIFRKRELSPQIYTLITAPVLDERISFLITILIDIREEENAYSSSWERCREWDDEFKRRASSVNIADDIM